MILWHNPRCGKSRQTLALLQEKGIEPEIRRYLEDAPSYEELKAVQAALGLPAIAMVRTKEAEFRDAGLSKDADDETLLRALAETPKLIERPILIAGERAAIGRPPEAVLALL